MEPKNPHLTAYDFLGYLVPGLATLALIDLWFFSEIDHQTLTYQTISDRYSEIKWEGLVPAIFLAYFLGHVVSFLSATVLERYAQWRYDTPAKFLIYETHGWFFRKSAPESSPYPVSVFQLKAEPIVNRLGKIVISLFIVSISLPDILLSNILGIDRRYCKRVSHVVKSALKNGMERLRIRLGLSRTEFGETTSWNHGFERLGLHFAIEGAPAHVVTLRNYVVLYGFLRSMTFVLILIFWTLIFTGCKIALCPFDVVFSDSIMVCIPVSGLALCSYAAFLKFWKRYHEEAIYAFLAAIANQADGPGKVTSVDDSRLSEQDFAPLAESPGFSADNMRTKKGPSHPQSPNRPSA
jgi:hypothetical protein